MLFPLELAWTLGQMPPTLWEIQFSHTGLELTERPELQTMPFRKKEYRVLPLSQAPLLDYLDCLRTLSCLGHLGLRGLGGNIPPTSSSMLVFSKATENYFKCGCY